MKTIDEIRASDRAHNSAHRSRRAAAGVTRVEVAVPASLRDTFRKLAASARAGATPDLAALLTQAKPQSLADAPVPEAIARPQPAAPVPEAVNLDTDTLRLAAIGRDVELLQARHPELAAVLHRAVVTQRGAFVAMLHTLFDTLPVAEFDAETATLPGALPVTPANPGDVLIQPAPGVRAPVRFSVGAGGQW